MIPISVFLTLVGFMRWDDKQLTVWLRVCPPGVLLVSPVLRVGLVSADGSLCKLLEVVCGSWFALPAGEDRRNRCFSYGGSLHRGGQPAAVQGAEHELNSQIIRHHQCNEIRFQTPAGWFYWIKDYWSRRLCLYLKPEHHNIFGRSVFTEMRILSLIGLRGCQHYKQARGDKLL